MYGGVSEVSTVNFAKNFSSDPQNCFLVDVRTKAEWSFIGVPDLRRIAENCNQIVLVEWVSSPTFDVNQDFAQQLEKQLLENWAGGDDTQIIADQKKALKETTDLYFICRSGARSRSAAEVMSRMGFVNCNNITHGFEGDLDQNRHRGKINGWKADKLPWQQS